MADVYLADDGQLGRRVALKLLHRRFAGDPDFVERFRREAQSAAGLQHPNIVSVYDRGEWDGTSYISMEYLPGRTLKELIRDEAPLDPERAVAIGLQIANAARFAHRGGIIHRDLKPQNVIVDDEDRAVVTDFGIARAGASGVTEAGSVMGTAQYVSPEQAQGSQVGAASDIYSIGVVLYEMLTGRVPFDAESPVAIAMKHVTEEPRPPAEVIPGIPADLDATVTWTLRKSADERPGDADQLVKALDAILERLKAGRDSAATVAFAAPVAAAAGVTAGVTAAAVPGVTAPTLIDHAVVDGGADGSGPGSGDDEPGESGGAPRRRWLVFAGIVAIAAAVAAAFMFTRPEMVSMPLVVGKDLQTATTIIANAGVTGSPSVQRVESTKPRGQVIRQEPLAGERIPADRNIVLVISDGPGSVAVPSVVELKEDEAARVLTKAGFKVVTREKSDPDVKAGVVISTDPTAGTNVERGSEVVMMVSSGAEKVAVPNVVGQDVADARTVLSAAGFAVSTVKKTTSDQPEGTVLSQSPTAGAEAVKGSEVVLTVAAEQKPTSKEIPDVFGRTKTQATTDINSAGFSASFTTVDPTTNPTCTTALAGKAVDQDPAAGGKAAEGTTVKVFVCAAP